VGLSSEFMPTSRGLISLSVEQRKTASRWPVAYRQMAARHLGVKPRINRHFVVRAFKRLETAPVRPMGTDGARVSPIVGLATRWQSWLSPV
jgi:hypothetical protein